MLGPFSHPVAFCWMLLPVVLQSLKPFKLLAPCKRVQHCWELLRQFAESFTLENCFFRMSSYPCAYVCITYKQTQGKFPDEHLEAFYGNKSKTHIKTFSSSGFIRSAFNEKFSLLSPYFNPFSPESGQC